MKQRRRRLKGATDLHLSLTLKRPCQYILLPWPSNITADIRRCLPDYRQDKKQQTPHDAHTCHLSYSLVHILPKYEPELCKVLARDRKVWKNVLNISNINRWLGKKSKKVYGTLTCLVLGLCDLELPATGCFLFCRASLSLCLRRCINSDCVESAAIAILDMLLLYTVIILQRLNIFMHKFTSCATSQCHKQIRRV